MRLRTGGGMETTTLSGIEAGSRCWRRRREEGYFSNLHNLLMSRGTGGNMFQQI